MVSVAQGLVYQENIPYTLGSEAESSTMGCFRTKVDVKPLQMA